MVLEKTLESPLDCKEIQPVHPKGDQFWVFTGRTDAEAETLNTLASWCKELTHWKRPWCWEGLGAGGEGDNRGWDGWMASLTRWTWVWMGSGSWWWTGRPGVLWSTGSQRVRQDWPTELNWTVVLANTSMSSYNYCFFFLWQEHLRSNLLATFNYVVQYFIYSPNAMGYIPRTDSTGNWMFLPFDQHLLISSTPLFLW